MLETRDAIRRLILIGIAPSKAERACVEVFGLPAPCRRKSDGSTRSDAVPFNREDLTMNDDLIQAREHLKKARESFGPETRAAIERAEQGGPSGQGDGDRGSDPDLKLDPAFHLYNATLALTTAVENAIAGNTVARATEAAGT